VRGASIAILCFVLVGACGDEDNPSSAPRLVYSTELRTGIATYYAADGSGSCSFDPSPDDLDVVALGPDEYAASAACGGCVRVQGPKGEVTVRVVDSCPECPRGHLDLSREAFAKIAEPAKGRVSISYQSVACRVNGNLSYHFKDGSSKWWTAIQVRNHPLPVADVEYRRGDAWVSMKRQSYNYFVAEDGVGDQPSGLSIRVRSADGRTVEDRLPGSVPDDATVPGTTQFD